ncbi:MAG: dihydroorotase family protein [Acidimicrobiales bacterium]|nr:dihydroorotase family protein [Acidimicrobiales bacterium]
MASDTARIDRVIENGEVVSGAGLLQADLLIAGEKIAAIAAPGSVPLHESVERIDATGKWVLPGMIDVHVHLREPGYVHKEDISTCTQAAAAGGVTTVFGMPNLNPVTKSREILDELFDLYDAKSLVDWNHNPVPSELAEVESMAEAGVAAYKIYMVVDTGRDYPHPSGTGIHDHGHLLRMFEAIRPTGRPFMVHPHDQAIMDTIEQSHWERGDRSPAAYAQTLATHNGLIWDSAIAVLLQMAEATDTKLHIVHMQTEGSIELVRRARERGVKVSCEVNHWALFLSRWSDIEKLGPYALSYWVPDHHREAVWEALNDGTINMLSSDHAPHTRKEKEVGWEDCWACHTGTPGIQEQYPLLLDESMNGRIPLTRVAEVVAEEPATEFGLSEKGFLKPGYDADIMIFDPKDQTRHSADGVLSKCGWTCYDGRVTRGRIHRTMVRGRDVYVDREVVGEPGWGQLARPAI